MDWFDQLLAQYPDVAELGHQVYTPAGLRAYLSTPLARFDGRMAIELLIDGQPERVVSALASDYEGQA